MNNKSAQDTAFARTPANTSFLPDFCDIRLVFGVVVIAELLALVLVLVEGPAAGDAFWSRLGLISLFLQWIALTGAALLCAFRRFFPHLGNIATAVTSYLLLLLVTVVLSELAYYTMAESGLVQVAGHAGFVLRNLAISAIFSALLLRYLYVQHQWKLQVQAEALARLQALRARIRPHFLFNSLNTIAALTRTQPEVAEEAVQDLSDLFRATLGDARDRVPLADEIALTRQYVQLEQLRLGDRLEVDWELTDIPAQQPVPYLMIQPLVENAIYHGIEALPEGGVIRVRVQSDHHHLVIRISNPTTDHKDYSGHEGNRIAQENIRQRLELAYGHQAGLQAEQHEARYEVELRLPLEQSL